MTADPQTLLFRILFFVTGGAPRVCLLIALLLGAVWGGSCLPAAPLSAGESASAGSPAEVVARVNELRREIARHDDLYFRQAAPEISDFEYDRLKRELVALEENHPGLEFAEPPVAAVGDDRTGAFLSHPHRVPMLSLDKAMSEEDLLVFHRRVAAHFGREDVAYWIEPKFDGIAVSLIYERGRLVRALTRGDGGEGEEITENVRRIGGVPVTLGTASGDQAAFPVPDLVEIRGEIFMTFAEFARINSRREEAGEPVFANPRNLAAGTARLRDPGEGGERRLEVVCFGWGAFEPVDRQPASLEEFHGMLTGWGLPTVETGLAATGLAEMLAAVSLIEESRHRLSYPIDGAVVKLALTAEQSELGSSRSAPRWAVAVKFPPDRAMTRLRGITLQVGRTGVVTPVAELEPVLLAGSTVARATLHNAAEIARRDLRVGDRVYVEKSGDIIPAVVGVDRGARPEDSVPYRFPEECPECGSGLEQFPGRAAWRCRNVGCPAQVARRLEHFVSVMGIRGFGPATVSALIDHRQVRVPSDLYRLQREDLVSLPGIGQRSAENLIAALEASRGSEWERVVEALGIPGVGRQRARALANAFPGAQALLQADLEQLVAPEAAGGAGLSEAIALLVADHVREPAIRELLTELDPGGVQPLALHAVRGALAGEVVVVTGTLQRWSRREVSARLAAAGARVSENVTVQTTLLVAGERPGSKLERARALGIAVIGEEELVKRLEP